jgi:DMSO/TMAO reductase YedYZ molybdopterin-dependent catalytic subunit
LARGALVGALAALVASGVMLWAGRSWGGAIVAQLLSDRMTAIIPLKVFDRALSALESDAKPFTLAGLTIAQVALGALGGAAYARVARSGARARLAGGATLALVVWLLLNLVAAPLGNVGVFAKDLERGVGATQATFILAAVIFGALTALCLPLPAFALPHATDAGRRRLLTVGALGAPAFISTIYIGRYVQELRGRNARINDTVATTAPPAPATNAPASAPQPAPTGFAFAGMPPEVTPVDQFYIVSKNFVDPKVDAGSWMLEVSGLVNTPLRLSYTDLTNRPSTEFTSTLECISNEVGGHFMSNGVWQGFPLATLLDEAGLQDGVYDIELHGADGYVESIPLEKARDPQVMVVHTLDGQPLPDEHGKPARLIVPNIYGMKNVKWLTRIVAVKTDVIGYWEDRGWSDVATVQLMSRIDAPKSGTKAPVGQPLRVGGVAFAGQRGIAAVEVSLDGEKTWQMAELDDAPSPLTWRLWAYTFTPTQTGKLSVTVRATDRLGNLQDATERDTLPDGATGYHAISLKVV